MVSENLTPLHLLATNLNEQNFENIFKCIKKLIDRQANVNIPNQRDVHPIVTIAKKRIPNELKEKILKYILENAIVDLDKHRKGEARTVLSKDYPNLALPAKKEETKIWDFVSLIRALTNGDEIEFIEGFDWFLDLTKDHDNRVNLFRERSSGESLLTVTARTGLVRAAEKLLRSGADVNNYKLEQKSDKYEKLPIEVACIYGNWQVLELFLKCSNVDLGSSNLLSIVIKNIGDTPATNSCNYKQCFRLLLQHKGIDINQKDTFGNTALHTAVKYNNKSAILALLDQGAYVGSQNVFNDFSITDIDPKILEKHLNNCITTNDRRPGDDNYEIQFNYSNLVPGTCRKNEHTRHPTKLKHSDEMAPIEYMAKSSELKHLIKHPLIASFLFLKWHRLALVFYTNFLFYTVYCMSIIFYLLFCYGQDVNPALAGLLYTLSVIGVLYVLTRELAQFVMSPNGYLRNKENYMEIALIAMTIVVLINPQFSESSRRTVAAFTILLAVGEFFLLSGSLPVLSFSTHLVMLKTVSKSFLKGLLLYSMILIAFALCFYTLLGEDSTVQDKIQNITATEVVSESPVASEEDDEFNKFAHPGVSFIKTVVMLTGEFDASSINFKQNISSYVIFLIFVFLISTVLVNLLNGLAVSDTQVKIFETIRN